MPSTSRSLLTAVLLAPTATGCFLSGDYRVKEETVVAVGADTSDEVTSVVEANPSEAPAPPTSPPPSPTGTQPTGTQPTGTPAVGSGEETSRGEGAFSTAAVSTEGAPSNVPSSAAAASTEVLPPITTDSNATSEPSTRAEETDDWQGSNNAWWDSSGGRCWQGDCNDGCGDGEVRGPQGRCYWFNAGQGTWNQAQTACSNHGTGWVPIAIHDEQEDGFMSSRLNPQGQTWLGARYSMGSWRWIDDNTAFWSGTGLSGSAIDGVFAKWGTNEPSGSNGETCGRVESFNNDMRWGDSECNGIKLIACQSPVP